MSATAVQSSWLVVALVASVAWDGGAEAAERLRVVATIPDLKALTEEVGGNLVEVDAPWWHQNPHDLEARPSLMVKGAERRRPRDQWPRSGQLGRKPSCSREEPEGDPRSARVASTPRRAFRVLEVPTRASGPVYG